MTKESKENREREYYSSLRGGDRNLATLAPRNHRAYLIIIAVGSNELLDGEVHAVFPTVIGVAGYVDALLLWTL